MPTSKQRREAERRRLQRQLQRRSQREARRKRYTLLISVIGTLLVVAVVIGFVVATSGEDKKANAGGAASTSASPSSSAASSSTRPAPVYPCTWKKAGKAAKKVTVPPTTTPSRKGTVDVAVQSTQGAMTFTLNRAAAPCAVESFISLAQQKYYNSTSCHRLTSGGLSVLQCGDPLGNGSGGPGYSFGDELTGKEKYTTGVLAMANSGANTNGSQFFIVYKDSQLSPNYTVFGTVSKGLAVVQKVAAKGSNPANDGKPVLPITLTKVTVAK